jgi:pectin methylesterase-like acyl-CoA thioesterase
MKRAALLLPVLVSTSTMAQPGVAQYLAQGPSPWAPVASEAMAAAKADFVVDAQGGGTHRTVQAAVDAVPAQDTRRWVIQLRAGTYREPLCIRDKAPLLLRGDSAATVRIVEGRYNTLPKAVGAAAHACVPALDAGTHGTSGSTSVAVFSDDVQLARLSIANDATAPSQAVALTTAGDRIQLDGVQLWGHQDTFYARRRERELPARVFVRDSLIAGDVDFVFGNATLVITHSTLLSRASLRNTGIVLAPSTLPEVPLGFLVTHSRFTAEAGLASGAVALGRSWDQGVAPGTWQAGVSPNGQALVRDSELGPHIGPWAASTSRRPYSAGGNRLAEHDNRRASP